MDQFQKNTINSFRKARQDIVYLQEQVLKLVEGQEKIMGLLSKKNTTKTKTIKKSDFKNYIASKNGDKFHIEECPFAKNIKPKSKVLFKSKTDALNKGYKACECVKKS